LFLTESVDEDEPLFVEHALATSAPLSNENVSTVAHYHWFGNQPACPGVVALVAFCNMDLGASSQIELRQTWACRCHVQVPRFLARRNIGIAMEEVIGQVSTAALPRRPW